MKLYTGTTEEFTQDVLLNRMPDKLQRAYEGYYYRMANPREVVSWANSLQFVKNVIEYAPLKDDMVLMELKQWSKVEDCEIENNVITFVGGANRMEAHPSYQIGGYHMYLKDLIEVFEESPR